MSRFTGRLWKWVVPAGITLGLLGLWAPAEADDKKEVEKDPEIKSVEVRTVEITKTSDEDRKEGTRKEVRKEGERKEEGRKEEVRKGEGSGDSRIDELTKIVKQLSNQVHELRDEVRRMSGGLVGGPNPEEMRRRMEEAQKKFAAGNPGAVATEKYREEMERRFKEQGKFAREGGAFGQDAENQIRREIERLNAQLKQISAAREREGDAKIDKKEPKKEGDRKESDKKEGDKEDGDRKEVKKDGDKEDGDKKDDKKEDDKKEDKK
ncbi:MAG: hypothetical protein IAF94_24285, partial [Pirellulaceae bacterium]|nr:hypothetical protein [Pirellulaceae bacterium]